MVFGVIGLGILAFVSLIVTTVLGILMKKGKRVLKYHKFFAYLTLILVAIHTLLVIL
jgi:hypothetical protein